MDDRSLAIFTNCFIKSNIALRLVLSLYCMYSLRQKSNSEVTDSIKRQMNYGPAKKFQNNITFSQSFSLSSFLESCLDVIEETHQMITDPKSHCTAHHLYEEHDDCEVPLMGGPK